MVLDVGALSGSLVGQRESNVRAFLKLADEMAPCVLFADEIEKALARASSSGQTDSGVTARVFGSLLTWLNDHESDVFFVGTCNDASKLPPEFARAERFDGILFVDLAGPEQRGQSGRSTRGPTTWPRNRPDRMTPTGPGPRSSRAAGWRRCSMSRSFKPRRTCRTRGCHCGRQDREPAAVGFRLVPFGGSGGRVFEVGTRQWRAG